MKQLKDMTLWELRAECQPSFQREEAQRKQRIADFVQALKPNNEGSNYAK